MRAAWSFLCPCLVLLGAVAAADPKPASAWPPLPTSGFIKGRVATQADVAAGNAIFVAEVDGKPSSAPLPLEIPQYAFLEDAERKTRVPVVVVQAEESGGVKIVGYREIATHDKGYALLEELELLGARPPSP